MEKVRISDNVIRRLPRYIRQLDMLKEAGVVRASSGEIGKLMGLTASQIRQDLNYFGGFGQPGYGYNVEELRRQLLEIMGAGLNRAAVLIGAGNIGRALLRNFKFEEYGVNLIAAFDRHIEPNEVNINGIPILNINEMENFIIKNKVVIAVFAIPGEIANTVAAKVALCGVRGIWNFTNSEIRDVPENVIVENVHFSDSLLALSYYLAEEGRDGDKE